MTLPNFGTIAIKNMAKPKSYNSIPKEVLERQEFYDNLLFDLAGKPNEAGVLQPVEDQTTKGLRMNLRYASKRTGLAVKANTVGEGTAEDPERIEFTVASPA